MSLFTRTFVPQSARWLIAERLHFTIGIHDDVTGTSLDCDYSFAPDAREVHEAMFFGLGSDGTVGANKNSIKIIGKTTDNNVQGYFVYDSKKAGGMTISHLRFGKAPIRKPYQIQSAGFIACHKFSFLERIDMLQYAQVGGVFLLAAPYSKDEVWMRIPIEVQKQIIAKELEFLVIDAFRLARDAKMGTHINTIMQTAFFLISDIVPPDDAITLIKETVVETYGGKGKEIVDRNLDAIELARTHIEQVDYPGSTQGAVRRRT